MSPKKMKGMLKNMGIDIEELENVIEVVIRMPDKEIVIENASVAIMDAHGVRSFQISGDARERSISGMLGLLRNCSRGAQIGDSGLRRGACGRSDRCKDGRCKGGPAWRPKETWPQP